MSEAELNKQYLYKRITPDMEYREIIEEVLKLCSERFIAGFRQSVFERKMLEIEINELKLDLIECKEANRQLTIELERVKNDKNK